MCTQNPMAKSNGSHKLKQGSAVSSVQNTKRRWMYKQRRDEKSAVRCNARSGQVSVSGTRPCIEIAVQLHAVSTERQNVTAMGAGMAPPFYTILCTQKGNCETPFCKERHTSLSFVLACQGTLRMVANNVKRCNLCFGFLLANISSLARQAFLENNPP